MNKGMLRTIGLAGALLTLPAGWAEASWRWLTKTQPCDILPFVVALTLLIEVLAIWSSIGQKHFLRVLLAVTAGNVLSFAAPYAVDYLRTLVGWSGGYSFGEFLEHWPAYTIRVAYLIVTVAVEIPIVYNALRKVTRGRRRLLMTIGLANVATTVFVAFIERIAVRGTWG